MKMDTYQTAGRLLIYAGIALVIIGVVITYAKGSFPLGNLPGDFVVRRPNFTFYFPLATSIIVSVVLSLILYFFLRAGK